MGVRRSGSHAAASFATQRNEKIEGNLMGTAKQNQIGVFGSLSISLGICLAFICGYCVYKQSSNQIPAYDANHSVSNEQVIAIKTLFANFQNKQIEFWGERKQHEEKKRDLYQVWIGKGELREIRQLPEVQREDDDLLIWWERVLHRDGLALRAIYSKRQKMEPNAPIINAMTTIQANENWKGQELSPHHSLFLGLFWNGKSNVDLKSNKFWENAAINYESVQSIEVIHTNGAKFHFEFDPITTNQLYQIRGELPLVQVPGKTYNLSRFELALKYKAGSDTITSWKETTTYQVDGREHLEVQNFQITNSTDWIRDKQNLELEFENVKNGTRVRMTAPDKKDRFEYREGRVAKVGDN